MNTLIKQKVIANLHAKVVDQIKNLENLVKIIKISSTVLEKHKILIQNNMLLGKKMYSKDITFVVLQKSIHVAFHKEYGAGNTTTQQFEKFLAKKYKLFSYPWKVDNHEPILSVKEIEARRASQ
jgi:hypothetical protein